MPERGDWLIRGVESQETLLLRRCFPRGKQDARALEISTRRVVTYTEDSRVARISGEVSAPAVGLVVMLNSAIRVAVHG